MSAILNLLIWSPVVGALLILGLGNTRTSLVRALTLSILVISLILAALLYLTFDKSSASMQFVTNTPWINTFNVSYHIGVDGISLPLVLLTVFITFVAVLATHSSFPKRNAEYLAALLMMEGLIIGVFCALDGILFYVFWEASLVPMLLMIGIWGGQFRVYAAIKFFLYTFLGSVLMLISLIYLYQKGGSFSLLEMQHVSLGTTEQKYIFWAFFLAFAVKIPMFPVHTWLPHAHVQAPTAGSVILAAVMLKMGGYGLYRLSIPIVPHGMETFAPVMVALSLIAIVYISFIALVQTDLKKLIAYSSVAHMGFVTLGIFAFFLDPTEAQKTSGALGLGGGLIQMVSHGLISAALFLMVGILYKRLGSRTIDDYGGVMQVMPTFTFFAVFFAMSNSALPGTSGFVGEFMVIVSTAHYNLLYAFLAGTTLILGAAYTLWMVKRVFWGTVENKAIEEFKDLDRCEWWSLLLLAMPVLALGLYPQLLVNLFNTSISDLLNLTLITKL